MSTKIYNGYIFDKRIKNLNQAHQELKKIRKSIEKKTKQIFSLKIARILVSLYDNLQNNCLNSEQIKLLEKFKENNYSNNLISEVIFYTENLAREESKSPYRVHYEYDFNAEVCIYEVKNRVLLLYFGAMPEIRKEFESSKLISEYIYQNQTDKPRNVSDFLWKKREKDWEAAMGDDTPQQSGLFYTFFKTNELFLVMPSYDDTLKNISKVKERELWLVNSHMNQHESHPKFESKESWDVIGVKAQSIKKRKNLFLNS